MLAYRLELRDILVASVEFYRSDGGTHPEPRFLQFPHAAQLAGRRVLIVDEVWETGETMEAVAARVRDAGGLPQTAVLHFKPGRSRVDGRPDHWAAQVEDWVRYPYKAGA
jgi:hypoxanthine phosphoribosyltransferase